MARILIVEDENDLANLLLYNVKQDGHDAEVASTGATAVGRYTEFKPDVVLLDLMLPDVTGIDVIRMLKKRSREHKSAVIMLTAKGSEADRIAGFEEGADDYVVKPFSVREVMLRIQAILRRSEPTTSAASVIEQGELRIDVARHEVMVGGSPVVLTALEFRLLQALMGRAGRMQTRETLLSDVWGITVEVETRTVDTHIKRLRQKLGAAGDRIETIRGVGYRFVSDT